MAPGQSFVIQGNELAWAAGAWPRFQFEVQGGRLLRIRLARTGTNKKPSYRVVVIERDRARDGGFVEIVGHYNPRREPVELVLKRDRVDYWLGQGAQPSETVRSLLKKSAQE